MSVFDVANYFLTRVEEDAGSVMTHLKLQKLCYYAQAWYLAFEKEELFNENFEAWAHGPVCPELWYEYRENGYDPLPIPEEFDPNIFEETQQEVLDEVWRAYGQFEAKYLERLTHKEEPWINARGACPPGESCKNIISKSSMQTYYGGLVDNG